MDTVKLPIETEGTSAALTTTMQISAININPSIVAREPTALDLTSASYNPSTGTEMHINDSIMPSPFEVSTVSASQNDFHHCSNYVNRIAGGRLNMPYKVNIKSL